MKLEPTLCITEQTHEFEFRFQLQAPLRLLNHGLLKLKKAVVISQCNREVQHALFSVKGGQ